MDIAHERRPRRTLLIVIGAITRRSAPVLLATGTILVAIILVLGANTALRSDSVCYTIFFIPVFAAVAGWIFTRFRITA